MMKTTMMVAIMMVETGDCCGDDVNTIFCNVCQCLDPNFGDPSPSITSSRTPRSLSNRCISTVDYDYDDYDYADVSNDCDYCYWCYWCYDMDISEVVPTLVTSVGPMIIQELLRSGTGTFGSVGSAAIPNFAGPQPGTPGGGISPTAIANPTASLSAIASTTVSAGTSIFAGLSLVGAGQLVAVFDLPRSNDNFAAVSGIFEEGNGGQRRGKREIKERIVPFAEFLLWITQTLEQGLSNIFRYIHTTIHKTSDRNFENF